MTTNNLQERIRNFAIIAHIDHGKSTLADRLLEATGTIPPRKMRKQFLDNMELEREKGITIKLKTVRMLYRWRSPAEEKSRALGPQGLSSKTPPELSPLEPDSGELAGSDPYIFNLVDTPGHVDFSYEVSRSLAACEGALLLVDASQGVQAQTVSNAYKALDLGLTVIPLVNKIDLGNADPEGAAAELREHLDFSEDETLFVSAKEGKGTDAVLEAIIERVPAPEGDSNRPLRALVFDSFYDEHKGVVAIARVVDGNIGFGPRQGKPSRFKDPNPNLEGLGIGAGRLRFLGSGAECEPLEIGYLVPEMEPSEGLLTGEVGYIATGLKDISKVGVGDTITAADPPAGRAGSPGPGSKRRLESSRAWLSSSAAVEPLLGYKEPKAVVFANIFPVDKNDFVRLKDALGKLRLSDGSLEYRPISSPALGRGFELGLLGLLHLEIVKERLEREYELDLVVTAPTVEYEVRIGEGKSQAFKNFPKPGFRESPEQGRRIKNASELPEQYDQILEPWAEVEIITPYQFLGEVMGVINEARGKFLDQEHLGEKRAKIRCEIPLAELVTAFYDQLESCSSGFASLDWSFKDYRSVEAGKLEILVNREVIEPFSRIVVKDQAYKVGRRVVSKLKKVLPREQFMVPVQARFNGRIIARESISALRKDVTAKLYGGDQTRKDKLLKKQKAGKKKLAQIGKVQVPKEAFREISEV